MTGGNYLILITCTGALSFDTTCQVASYRRGRAASLGELPQTICLFPKAPYLSFDRYLLFKLSIFDVSQSLPILPVLTFLCDKFPIPWRFVRAHLLAVFRSILSAAVLGHVYDDIA